MSHHRIVLSGHIPLSGNYMQDAEVAVRLRPIFEEFHAALKAACPEATFAHEHETAPKIGRPRRHVTEPVDTAPSAVD